MKEAIVHPDTSVKIVDSPIPTAGEHQVIIKVIVSGTNPKDWKMPKWHDSTCNSGDDVAGTIHAVGPKVLGFKLGDRVAAFHEMMKPHGSFAEYALAWDHTTFHIPEQLSYEEAATLPLAAMTSALGLFQDLKIPEPWGLDSPLHKEENLKVPILIYGVGSATGAFAAQFARLAGLKPIIGVAGQSKELASRLSDHVIDYRNGEDAVVKGIEDALQKEGLSNKLKYVFDAISEKGSHELISRVVDSNGGAVSHLLPPEKFAKSGEDFKYPVGVKSISTWVGQAHDVSKDFAAVWFQFFSRLLVDGRLKPHPHQVIPGGLAGVEKGLKSLAENKASGVKYVYRIQETEGVSL